MEQGTRWLPRVAAPLVLAAIIVGGWETLVRSGSISDSFLPAPSHLAARFWDELVDGPMLGYVGVTLVEALYGTLIAVLVAVPLGYLIARIHWVDLAVTPYVAASQAIPAVALAPLLALWIGYGTFPIALLCAIVAFFPMLITTALGVRHLPKDVLEAARLDGAGWWQSLVWVEAPLAMPSVLAGVRAGIALSVTGAVVGEFTMGGEGLGLLLTVYRDANDTEGMFATLIMLAGMAVALFTVLRVAEALAGMRTRLRARERRVDPVPDDDLLPIGETS